MRDSQHERSLRSQRMKSDNMACEDPCGHAFGHRMLLAPRPELGELRAVASDEPQMVEVLMLGSEAVVLPVVLSLPEHINRELAAVLRHLLDGHLHRLMMAQTDNAPKLRFLARSHD